MKLFLHRMQMFVGDRKLELLVYQNYKTAHSATTGTTSAYGPGTVSLPCV
jgi:hypothetical protein